MPVIGILKLQPIEIIADVLKNGELGSVPRALFAAAESVCLPKRRFSTPFGNAHFMLTLAQASSFLNRTLEISGAVASADFLC